MAETPEKPETNEAPQAAPAASPAVRPVKQVWYAFVTQEADRNILKQFAQQHKLPAENVREGDIRQAVELLKTDPSPSILMVEVPSAEEAPALLEKLSGVCDPDTKVVVCGKVNEFTFYNWLMDLGIAAYILQPFTEEALAASWDKLVTHVGGGAGKAPAQIFGFIGARGGVGTSTLVLMSAALLQKTTGKKVAVVDLDPYDGCLSLMLDLDPSRGLREALERPERIDPLFLDRVMTKDDTGLFVLAAEEPLHVNVTIHAEAAEKLVEQLRNQFDYVLCDFPNRMNDFCRYFAAASARNFVVTEFSLSGLRDTLRLIDYYRDGLRLTPPSVIASRVGLASKQEMGESEFKKGLGAEIDFKIPFAPDFFMQVNTPMDALANKKSAGMKALQALIEGMLPEDAEQEVTDAKGSKGLLKKRK